MEVHAAIQGATAVQADRNRRGEDSTDSKLAASKPVTEAVPRRKRSLWHWGGAAAASSLLAAAILYFMPVPVPKVTGSTQLTNGADPKPNLVTDGLHLYFCENRTGAWKLAQISVAGGDLSLLRDSISFPRIEDISLDHSRLLLSSSSSMNAPLWTMPLPEGSPRRLGDIEANGASWAPDGEHLVFKRFRRLPGRDRWQWRKKNRIPDAGNNQGRTLLPRWIPNSLQCRQ